MATKVIYFTVNGHDEQAEFRADDNQDDVKDLFRAAAEAGPNDILKLYNTKGNLMCLSPKVPENTPATRYRLEMVAVQHPGDFTSQSGHNLADLESRIQKLETKTMVENGEMPDALVEIKNKLDSLTQKLEHVDHLSWLGLHKDITEGTAPLWHKQNSPMSRNPELPERRIYEKFLTFCRVEVTDEVRNLLKKPTFDNWQWDEPEMLLLLRQMYIDLNLHKKFNIELSTLQRWLFEVYCHYNQVPFHNFKHCFMVTQMMYGLTWLIDLPSIMDDIDLLILITSAICHDLDHPGYNNTYQVNARTDLAIRYNDTSPLENHHCSVGFQILQKPECNILQNLSQEQYKRVREGIIQCILATDMAKHSQILHEFMQIKADFDIKKKEHKDSLAIMLIKAADISNEARPSEVSIRWADCLMEEFFQQSDLEKLEGLPVAPFMDREKVSKSSSQVGFIKFVLLPLFEALGALFPQITDDILAPVKAALDFYQEMQDNQKKEEEERKKEVEAGGAKNVNAGGGGGGGKNQLKSLPDRTTKVQ